MREHRVVELEEAELHALAVVAYVLDGGGIGVAHACPVGFELLEDNLGAAHDALGHAGYLCHMDTEGVLAATGHELAQEDNLVADLLDAHIVVAYGGELALHLVELMIVGGKERAGASLGILVEVLDDGPGYADAVVGRGATPQFVEEHQRALGDIVEYVGSLGHFDHKSGLAERNIV